MLVEPAAGLAWSPDDASFTLFKHANMRSSASSPGASNNSERNGSFIVYDCRDRYGRL
jgi:hypothetical protein